MEEITLKQHIELANKGDVDSLYYLSYHYYSKRNHEKAFEYCHKAALTGNAEAQCTLGWYYDCGIGTNTDSNKAFYYYELSSKQGYAAAFDRLGTYYMFSKDKQDFDKAFEFYELGAKQNYIPAVLNLGALYETGRGVKKDVEKAFEYYKIAADDQYTPAYDYLYNCYINGVGTNKDIEKAVHYLHLSSLENDEFSAKILADFYHYGINIEKNIDKAIHYYNICVAENYDNGIYELGLLYKNQGNNKEALINFEKASELNNVCALWELATHHETHQKSKSLKYYKKIFELVVNNKGVTFKTDENNLEEAINKYKEVTRKYYDEEQSKMIKFRGLC